MKIKEYFNGWEMFKCTAGQWNYARCVSFLLFMMNSVFLILKIGYFGFQETNLNGYHTAIYCAGYITGMVLFALEIWRENKKISVKIGDKTYGAELGGGNA